MSEKIIVLNRSSWPVVCTEQGHSLRPGRSREVPAVDTVAAAGIASGALTVEIPDHEPVTIPEVEPEPVPAKLTKSKATKAATTEGE